MWPPNGTDLVGDCYCGICGNAATKTNRCIMLPAHGLLLCLRCLQRLVDTLRGHS